MDKTATLFMEHLADEKRACGLRVTSKDAELTTLWKVIHYVLLILSLGQMNRFYDGFTTTIGKTVYYPAEWRVKHADTYDIVTLRHEGRHVRQFIKWGLGNATLGIFVMGLFYLFLPLPMGLAWFRYMFERAAYKVSYYTMLELGLKPDIEHYIRQMIGPNYLWAWPFERAVRGWFLVNCHPAKLPKHRSSVPPPA